MFRRLYIVCLLGLFAMNLFAQKTKGESLDTLKAYHRRFFKDPTNPIVLTASDTLFRMAGQHGDETMKVVALSAKLDYYYYGDDEHRTDSIIAWTNRIKEFSEVRGFWGSFYFVWAWRLITHYIGMGEYNIALLETEKMLKDAEARDNKEGIADCFSCMSNIYGAKGLMQKSQEFMLKEIELFETYDLHRYNISFQYCDAAGIYIQNGEIENAEKFLQKSVEHSKTLYHKVTAKLAYVLLYLKENDYQRAKEELEECRQMYKDEGSIQRHIRYFYEVEIEYYRAVKNYEAALHTLDALTEELAKKNQTTSLDTWNKNRADIYWDMGRKENAAVLYREYLDKLKVEKEKSEEITTGEFATLLNIQKLNAEKKELERISQEKQLQNTRTILLFLATLLLIVSFFLYHQRTLYRRLKRSKDILDEKNEILVKAEEELRIAKDIAERSSWLKTVFIQNMSHEIRTPLNSIVGFSAVLADMFSEENEELKQYASVIEDNSRLLLKLIGDILDISYLDNEDIIEVSQINALEYCTQAVSESKPLLKEGVELSFTPTTNELIITSNGQRIEQVLTNLIENAAKFTFSGSIEVSCTMDSDNRMAVFTVTDTGIGIPAEDQERVFDRFVKLDDFTQGTGLGLSISKLIAEKLNGYLVIDKAYTEGTRMIFAVAM